MSLPRNINFLVRTFLRHHSPQEDALHQRSGKSPPAGVPLASHGRGFPVLPTLPTHKQSACNFVLFCTFALSLSLSGATKSIPEKVWFSFFFKSFNLNYEKFAALARLASPLSPTFLKEKDGWKAYPPGGLNLKGENLPQKDRRKWGKLATQKNF